MDGLYDLEALRPISAFAPEVRVCRVTVQGGENLENFGLGRGRAAEVLMVVRRPASSELLLIHKPTYPAGAHRLPTGGVEPGESPQQAATREIYEETGYLCRAPLLLGVVDYTLVQPELGEAPFVSFVFLADVPPDQPPAATDPTEHIDSYRWLPAADLPAVGEGLRALRHDWAAWGRFRAAAYAFILQAVIGYNAGLETG